MHVLVNQLEQISKYLMCGGKMSRKEEKLHLFRHCVRKVDFCESNKFELVLVN